VTDLNPKQKRFCEEYIIDLNASAAYKRAGYDATGAVADANASRLLRNARVKEYIDKLQSKRSHDTGITSERVLKEVARIAFADATNIWKEVEKGVVLKNFSEIDVDTKAAIAEITVINGKKTQVKMHSKTAALKDLMAYLGLTSDFNTAIASLRKYGLEVYQDDKGQWQIKDSNATNTKTDQS
jgi:phage terminase small subunit